MSLGNYLILEFMECRLFEMLSKTLPTAKFTNDATNNIPALIKYVEEPLYDSKPRDRKTMHPIIPTMREIISMPLRSVSAKSSVCGGVIFLGDNFLISSYSSSVTSIA